jgi:hypothetical protein
MYLLTEDENFRKLQPLLRNGDNNSIVGFVSEMLAMIPKKRIRRRETVEKITRSGK